LSKYEKPENELVIRLLDRVQAAIRVRQYSLATEKSYLDWVKRFILFHSKRHPGEMGKHEVESFLTHLAVNRAVSPSTQNQALQALLFLYRQVLEIELPWLDDVVRAKPKRHIPVVLSRQEVHLLLSQIETGLHLPASLMYGSGGKIQQAVLLAIPVSVQVQSRGSAQCGHMVSLASSPYDGK